MGYRAVATLANNSYLFGLYINNTNSSPFGSAWITTASTTQIAMRACSTTGTVLQPGASFTPVVGTDYILVVVFGVTTRSFLVFPGRSAPNW